MESGKDEPGIDMYRLSQVHYVCDLMVFGLTQVVSASRWARSFI